MNKNYETVFIINPVLSEKQVEDTVKKYKKQLDGKKVKFVCNESLGFKELAYSINKKKSFLIGDKQSDIKTAENANISGYLFKEENLFKRVKEILKEF